jgi:predicted outer membrane lipoprotein
MMLAVTILLMLLPVAAFLAWRLMRPGATLDPSPGLVLGLALAAAVGIGAAIWLGREGAMGRGEDYVPATLSPDGTITPGHGVPRSPATAR